LVGLVATAAMTLLELVFWGRWGLVGVLEWHENQMIWSRVSGRDADIPSPFGIFSLHFLNGGLAAIPFPFVARAHLIGGTPLLVVGLGYAVLLWVLTLVTIHKAVTGVSIGGNPHGIGPAVVSVLGHLVYGSLLALLASGVGLA